MPRLALPTLVLVLTPSLVLGWGQGTHGCITADMLQTYGSAVPAVLTDPATRDTYMHASFSPDQYVLQGPEYVHLDRHFSLMLFQHATNARQLALAYGWSTHQEEDTVGHGRFITEKGLPHLFKELVMDSRFLYQGSDLEKRTIANLGAAWDAEQISAASTDYVAKYGNGYKSIDQTTANITGYAFSAYIAALKGIYHVMWWTKVKWDSNLFPRSQWQQYVLEGVEQSRKWVQDPFAFGTSPTDLTRAQTFAMLDGPPHLVDVAPAGPLHRVDPAVTKSRIDDAMAVLTRPDVRAMALRDRSSSPLAASHVLLQRPDFLEFGHKLLGSTAIRLEEQESGTFHAIKVHVTNRKQLIKDVGEFLKSQKLTLDARVSPQASDEVDGFLQGLAVDAPAAADHADTTPEDE